MTAMVLKVACIFGCVGAVSACATLAGPSGDTESERPNAGAGPYRLLAQSEVGLTEVAPYVLPLDSARRYREPSAVTPAVSSGGGGSVALFVVVDADKGSSVLRFTSSDGRVFDPQSSQTVLVPTRSWEAGGITSPSACWVKSELWLAYAAAGGIGLARSTDGIHFNPAATPILVADPAASWEQGDVPSAPSLHVAPNGSLRLLYVAAGAIGEARSSDGATWTRDPEPILTAPDVPAVAGVAVRELGDPDVVVDERAGSRTIARVTLTLTLSDGSTAIGLAARYDDEGSLIAAEAPVLASKLGPRAASVVRFDAGYSLLYATARAGLGRTENYDAVLGAVAPATYAF